MKRHIITLILTASLSIAAFAQIETLNTSPDIDFKGFVNLSTEVESYRETRLVSQDEFFMMADEPHTIILDTRSKQAFDEGHIDGAVHLNFSDFTAEKLSKVLPSADVRILIYCNNNFKNDAPPFVKKSVDLALNVPTFINLYGYGYKNIYELGDEVDARDPAMRIVATEL